MNQRSLFRISALFFAAALLVAALGVTAGALRGGDKFDNNFDGVVDISDVTATLNYLAGGEGSVSTFDDNDDGIVDISDVTALLNHLAGGCMHLNVAIDPAIAPTCVKAGLSEGAHCADCGAVLQAQEEISAPGHSFENNYCTRCGVCDGSSCLYFESSDDACTVVGLVGSRDKVCIPAEYNGLPVTAIAADAFAEKSSLTYVEVPETVRSIGGYAFYYCENLREVVLPSTLTELGEGAFYDCYALESVEIPAGLDEVSDYAFYGCESLQSVVIPEGVTKIGDDAFYFCVSLGSVVVPEGVNAIGRHAFDDCYNLVSVTLPGSLEVIDYEAFNWCISLCSIEIPEKVYRIEEYAFYGCACLLEVINHSDLEFVCGSDAHGGVAYYAKAVHTGESRIVGSDGFLYYSHDGANYLVDYIGSEHDVVLPQTFNGQPYILNRYAFAYNKTLRNVVVPEGYTEIPRGAFYECVNLRTAVLPSTLESINDYAFEACDYLMSVNIPENVITIDEEAFAGCYRLAEVINESALDIRYGSYDYGYVGVYAQCIHTGESGISYIGDYAFLTAYGMNYLVAYFGDANYLSLPLNFRGEGYRISSHFAYDDDYIYSVDIPDSVTYIGEYAFCLCSNLTSVHFGKGVRGIGEMAFNITSLSEVKLPAGLETIGRSAFRFCDYLHQVFIPASVDTIGYEAFYDDTELKYVYYGGSSAQWNAIAIGNRNEPLTAAQIAYDCNY